MRYSGFTTFAERSIRLMAENFGSPCLQIVEEPEFSGLAPHRMVSIHDVGTTMVDGMDRLKSAVEAFNAAMDGATLLPVYPERVSPIPQLAELLDPTDLRRERNRPHAEAGDRVRESEDAGALSLR